VGNNLVLQEKLNELIDSNKISHAYLINNDRLNAAHDFAVLFAKEILGQAKDVTEKEKIYRMIDNNAYPELKIIKTEELWIKKEDIESLKSEFSRKPIMGNFLVYIIEESEKLNAKAGNILLKFLEEPDNDIIGIFTTNDITSVLSTIKSRCQLISLRENSGNNASLSEEFFENMFRLVSLLNQKNDVRFVEFSDLWINIFKEREESAFGFELLLNFYVDLLNFKHNRLLETYNEFIDKISLISKNLSEKDILGKINVIIKYKNLIKYNVNINMLLDKMVLEMEDLYV